MKIVHSILISFGIILLLFGITTFINFRQSEAVIENSEYTSKSTSIVRNSNRFQRNILTMVSGLRGYLLTGERSFVESYEAANIENDTILKDLSRTITDSSQKQLLQEISALNAQWTEHYTEPLKQAKLFSGISDSNLQAYNRIYRERFAAGEEKELQNRLQAKFRDFTNAEYTLRETKKAALAASVRSTRQLSFILTAVSVLIAIGVIVFLVRRISGRIGKMTAMANTISAGNYDVTIEDTGTDELSGLGQSMNHMARELSHNISLLVRSNAELDQFAHVVSHDMKGPLRGIDNVVTWIEEDHKQELSVKVSEYLELIKGRITRAENLIAGLLAYARVDKDTIQKETVDVKELVGEVVDNLPNMSQVAVDIGPMPIIYTERILLFQIFANLIGNAVKHNDKPQGMVKIYHERYGDSCRFFIEDNGVGIDPKHQERIFQIFQTLRDRDSFESAGVGLAIVKKILDSKKQSIQVVSAQGKGSIFSFTWPTR